MARTELFARKQAGGAFTIAGIDKYPGTIFFVNNSVAGAADSASRGQNPDVPLATIDYAIGLCTANVGDVIIVGPGHNEGLGDAQITVDKAGITIMGIGRGSLVPRIDFDHANASIDITANGCTLRNLRLLPSITDVLIAIDINAAVTDTLIEDVEALPGEDGGGVDDFAATVELKAGCNRTVVRRLKVVSSGSAAGYIAGVRLKGASDDVLIEDCYINIVGAGVVAPINADTTLSTNVRIKKCLLVTDAEPGIEVITGTTGVVQDCDIFTDLATIAAAITGNGGASGMAQFRCQYIEVAPESGAVVGTPSADD